MIINHLIKSESIESDSLDWFITTGATGTTTVAAKFSDTLTLFQPWGANSPHHCSRFPRYGSTSCGVFKRGVQN